MLVDFGEERKGKEEEREGGEREISVGCLLYAP